MVAPIGFISDLDTEARHAAAELGLNMSRAGTVGTHPAFVRMIAGLIEERAAWNCAPARHAESPRSRSGFRRTSVSEP